MSEITRILQSGAESGSTAAASGAESASTSVRVHLSGEPSTQLIKELRQFKDEEIKWHTILVPEDALVAALHKSLLRNGEQIQSRAAYQAVRDILGELVEQFKAAGREGLLADLNKILKSKDGSDDDKRPTPIPNP